MGKCYDSCGEFDHSVSAYKKALEMAEGDSDIMFKLGWAFLRSGQKAEGLVWMRKSIGKGETNVRNSIKLAEVLMRQDTEDHHNEAIEILEKTLSKHENRENVDAMVVLGRAYEKLN